ncbi:hypothetical protein ACWCOW_39875, partial [Streptomyces sp. NPDC001939]
EPQGLALLDDTTVVVADTVHHSLKAVDLTSRPGEEGAIPLLFHSPPHRAHNKTGHTAPAAGP